MKKPISPELRQRVIAFTDGGRPPKDIVILLKGDLTLGQVYSVREQHRRRQGNVE